MHDHHKVCDLQVQNAAPPAAPGQVNGQAVAVLLANDKAAFYGCGFYGGQDTLFDYSGRHYFKDCYFEGNIDIISGNGQSVFKVTAIHHHSSSLSWIYWSYTRHYWHHRPHYQSCNHRVATRVWGCHVILAAAKWQVMVTTLINIWHSNFRVMPHEIRCLGYLSSNAALVTTHTCP